MIEFGKCSRVHFLSQYDHKKAMRQLGISESDISLIEGIFDNYNIVDPNDQDMKLRLNTLDKLLDIPLLGSLVEDSPSLDTFHRFVNSHCRIIHRKYHNNLVIIKETIIHDSFILFQKAYELNSLLCNVSSVFDRIVTQSVFDRIVTQPVFDSNELVSERRRLTIFQYTVQYNRLDMVKYMVRDPRNKTFLKEQVKETICTHAAQYGSLQCLIYLHESENCLVSEETLFEATRFGDVELLKYLFSKKCPYPNTITQIAAMSGYLDCLEYLVDQGCPINEYTMCAAVSYGHFGIVKYLLIQKCPVSEQSIITAAASGELECLIYLFLISYTSNNIDNNFSNSSYNRTVVMGITSDMIQLETELFYKIMNEVARGGHLDCLLYFIQRKCPCDEYTIVLAAQNNHLDCVQLLHESGCPWTVSIFDHIAAYSRIDCLEFLYKTKFPNAKIDEEKSKICRGLKNECFDFLTKPIHQPEEELLIWDYGHLSCLIDLYEQGYQWTDSTLQIARMHNHKRCINFLESIS